MPQQRSSILHRCTQMQLQDRNSFPAAAVRMVSDGRPGVLLRLTARLVQLQAVVVRHMCVTCVLRH